MPQLAVEGKVETVKKVVVKVRLDWCARRAETFRLCACLCCY